MLRKKLIEADHEYCDWCRKKVESEVGTLVDELECMFLRNYINSSPQTRFCLRHSINGFELFMQKTTMTCIDRVQTNFVVDLRYHLFFEKLLEEQMEKSLGIEMSKLEDFSFEELLEE